MRSTPRVSVVMSSYNQEAFVGPAITSILAQTVSDWELIVVDDGSTDGSHAFAVEQAKRDHRITALRKQNGGHCSALNFGLMRISAGSEYLFFLDGDDLLKPRYLEVSVGYLDAHADTGLVCCQADQADRAGKIVGAFRRSRWVPGHCGLPRNMRAAERATPFVVFFCATGQSMSGLYRRSVFARTEGWDTRFTRHEDTDMLCQMALLAEVHTLPDVLYTYRIHDKNITCLSDCDAARVFPVFRVCGYATFREKWDSRPPRNEHERQMLDSARQHYYGVHRPLRSVKIAAKAILDFGRTGRLSALCWAAHCFWDSLASAVRFWVFTRSHLAVTKNHGN